MFLKLFMFVAFWIVVPILYWTMKKGACSNKNMILGVEVPKEYMNEPEIEQICRQFDRRMNWIAIAVTVIGLLIAFLPYISVVLTLDMIWICVVIVIFLWPFGMGFRRMKALKKEKGWGKTERKVVMVDTELAGTKVKIRFLPYLPPVLISFLPLIYECIFHFDRELFLPTAICLSALGACTALMWLCAWGIGRMRNEVISTDSTVNQNYNRIRITNWNHSFLGAAWLNVAYTLVLWLYMEADLRHKAGGPWFLLFLAASLLYAILLCAIFIRHYNILRANQKKLLEQAEALSGDEDDNWIWGMFYYNPNDRHFMVNRRVGVGTTCNMATVGGKVLTGFGLAVMLISIIICASLIGEEFTSVDLSLNQNQIEASHRKTEYRVDLAEAESVELLTEGLPEVSKEYGTYMDNVGKGVFWVKGYKECRLCCNPANQVFIVITLKDQSRYIFSDKTDEETMVVYEQILLPE